MSKDKETLNHLYWLTQLGLYDTRYIIYWWHDCQPWDDHKVDKSFGMLVKNG